MKFLWFFVVLICVATCRQVDKDKVGSGVEDEEAVNSDLFNENDAQFPNEEWQDWGVKDDDIEPNLFWSFDSLANSDLEAKQEQIDPFYKVNYEVSEEKSDFDSPFFLTDDDVSDLLKEKSFYNFLSENNDESAEKLKNDDWLYPDYADLLNELNKQKEEEKMVNKNVDMEIIPLPDTIWPDENNGKLSEEKANDDWFLFPLRNDYDYISYMSDKQNEEKKNNDFSSNENFNIDDIQSPFDQLRKMAEYDITKIKDDKKGNDDLMQFPIEDDYDYFIGKLDKLNQEMKDMEPLNKNENIEVTLLTNAKNKITIRVVSIQDNDMIYNPEIADGKKELVWEAFPEGKYIDSYEYTDNSDFDDRVLAYRYSRRSSMFMVSSVLVVFSIMIFSFCLLCKIFKSKKKDSAYQPLHEEVA